MVTNTRGRIRVMSLATTCDVAAMPTEKGRNARPVLSGLYPITVCRRSVRKNDTAKIDPVRPSITM